LGCVAAHVEPGIGLLEFNDMMPIPPHVPNGQPPPADPYFSYPTPLGAPVSPSTNTMAIASLVCAFLFAPLAIVFGHIALSPIKQSDQSGRALAITGLVLGYVFTVLAVAALVVLAIVVDALIRAPIASTAVPWNFI
jgi:peptidyl-prolyl cis-trans isomerase B (cyclophilin B)